MPYIDGLEICNEPKNEEQVTYLYEFAKKHNLLIFTGNDFHGSEKHTEVGVNNINETMEQEILSWVNKTTNKIEL